MAVVSISRIQVRRGKKNSGTGLPQLASGEFGWAIDAQELYIGNGSVSEGAPAVGNTKILTDKDNFFEYAQNYEYSTNSAFINTNNVFRSLQDRLDDRVSVRAFGAAGDDTIQTEQLQRALFQLFLNDATKADPQSRHILHIEPGEYIIDNTLYVPPYTTIVGAGPEKTIIKMTGTGPAFRTINSDSTLSNIASDAITTTNTQARNIHIEGLTLELPLNVIGFQLENCRDSYFNDIEISGNWTSGTDSTDTAILLNGLSEAVNSNNNIFSKVKINGIAYAVRSDWDIRDNVWLECEFESNRLTVLFGENTIGSVSGQVTGPRNNVIENCIFKDIDQQAIYIVKGDANKSSSNRFYSVGNDGGSNAEPEYPVIQFDTGGNTSVADWFERSRALGSTPSNLNSVIYVPEIKGSTIYQNEFTNTIEIGQYSVYTRIFKLPADTYKSFEVEYSFESNEYNAKRQGTLHITVDPVLQQRIVSDEYDYIGDPLYRENFDFNVNLEDENSDGTVDSLSVLVLNSTLNDNGNFYYRVKTKS